MQIAIEGQVFCHIARIGFDDTCNPVATTTTANRLIGIAVDADIDGFLVEIDSCGNIGCFGGRIQIGQLGLRTGFKNFLQTSCIDRQSVLEMQADAFIGCIPSLGCNGITA